MLIPHNKGNSQRTIAARTAPLSKPVAMLNMTYPFILISTPVNQAKRAPTTTLFSGSSALIPIIFPSTLNNYSVVRINSYHVMIIIVLFAWLSISEKRNVFTPDINQTLKLNGTAHEYASVNKHPNVCPVVAYYLYDRAGGAVMLPLFNVLPY